MLEWFRRPEYEWLYQHRNLEEARQFLAGWRQHTNLPVGSLILDAGCGWGRHAYWLSRWGYRVWGVDQSPYLLARARQLVPSAIFIQHDLRYPLLISCLMAF